MCIAEFLTLCYALSSTSIDSISTATGPRDTVEYQVQANYSGYPAGWLTLLKIGHEYWFPLDHWLTQSGFISFHPEHKTSFHRVLGRNPKDHHQRPIRIGGYSPLQSKPWKIESGFQSPSMKGNPSKEHFVDQHHALWVSNRWIALQYGMATQFNEQALELEFTGKIKAPVREWSDYDTRWRKHKHLDSLAPSQDKRDLHRPHAHKKSFEISTWSGRYEINVQSGKVYSDVRWDATGHAGKVGFRVFGTSNMGGPGLELEGAWGTSQQINLIIGPPYEPSSWKIRGGNTLMNRTIGFEAPKGHYTRRWSPPIALSEWALNHGPFHYHPGSLKANSAIERTDRLLESRKHIPVDLLPGSNQIDYRYRNAWGGISSRKLLWNIPAMMIPHGQWNYRYEISAARHWSGIVGYGMSPSVSLQTETAVQPAKDLSRSLGWGVRSSALWTAGRILHGQSQFAIGHDHQKWEQRLHFNFSQSLQSDLLYQSCRYPLDSKPLEETVHLSGLWILPQGYGLQMLRLEYPFKKLADARIQHKGYQAILQFEGWGQQWLWQIPEHRLSWQGRMQFRTPAFNLVYQAIAHQEGWQTFVQGHLRGGHHFGVSYAWPRKNANGSLPSSQAIAGNWALEWKWVGLQSSRSARALLDAESTRLEYQGQFTWSRNRNTAPISATNGSALILLEFYGDQNANGIMDPEEINLDAAGAFDLPAGIPSQILVGGTALLGPFPNYSRIHVRLTPHHMRSPGWISNHPTMELQSLPNTTVTYRMGLIRGRQIFGTLSLSKIPFATSSNPLPTKPGGIRIHAHRWDEENPSMPCPINSTSCSPSSLCIQTKTLSDGYFEFNDLRPGLYKVWVDWSPLHRLEITGICAPQVLDLRQVESAELSFCPPSWSKVPEEP